MLHINDESLDELKKLHLKTIRCLIYKRLGSRFCKVGTCPICDSEKTKKIKGIPYLLKTILLDNDVLDCLILGSPNDILCLSELIMNEFIPKTIRDFVKTEKSKPKNKRSDDYDFFVAYIKRSYDIIIDTIDYDWFSSQEPVVYGAYQLADIIDRRTCTYCNRIYTTTKKSVDGGKLMRPQFDHWFPQEKYPLLALSFYNLIPSCSICNSSSKGRTVFNLDDYVHPYVDKN